MAANVVTGVISGLVSSFIVLFIALWWKRIFIPWLEDRLYKGTHIDGVWQTTMFVDSQELHEQVTLSQHGHAITGTINYPKDTMGRSHTYRVHGQFRDRTLTLIQEEVGHSHQDLGAIVLDFVPGGSEPIMKGMGVWPVDGKIISVEYVWTKTVS